MQKRYVLRSRTVFLVGAFLFLLYLPSCNNRTNPESAPQSDQTPAIVSVIISPEKPHKGIDLHAIVQSKSPGGSPITYKYQWIKNEELMIGETNASLSLKGDRFQKKDLMQVKVTPLEGTLEGRSLISAPVQILNSTPVVREIWIEPKIAYVYDSLKAELKSSDLDGDFVYYVFRWEKNGRALSEQQSQILERGQFKKGDSIAVIVIPDDREIQGDPKKSEPVIISNSPPVVTSSPSTSVSEKTYRYQVTATDPDHDPITFTLKSGPKGMIIDKNTGLLQWEIKKEGKGTHPIEIEALDNEGAKSIQRFTLTVDFR